MSTCDLLEIGLKGMRARTMQETAEERDQEGLLAEKGKGTFQVQKTRSIPLTDRG